MTDKKRLAIKRLLERHTKATTASKKTARESLMREGIYTKDGRLAPEYGGQKEVGHG